MTGNRRKGGKGGIRDAEKKQQGKKSPKRQARRVQKRIKIDCKKNKEGLGWGEKQDRSPYLIKKSLRLLEKPTNGRAERRILKREHVGHQIRVRCRKDVGENSGKKSQKGAGEVLGTNLKHDSQSHHGVRLNLHL